MSKWRGRKKRESERRKERDFCFRYSIGCVTVERCSSLWLALCLEGSPWRKGTLPTPWRAWTINWGQRVRPPVATCRMCEGCSFLFFIFKQASRLNSEVGGITVEWQRAIRWCGPGLWFLNLHRTCVWCAGFGSLMCDEDEQRQIQNPSRHMKHLICGRRGDQLCFNSLL